MVRAGAGLSLARGSRKSAGAGWLCVLVLLCLLHTRGELDLGLLAQLASNL